MLRFCIPEAYTVVFSCVVTVWLSSGDWLSLLVLLLPYFPITVLDPVTLDQSFFPNYELCASLLLCLACCSFFLFFF